MISQFRIELYKQCIDEINRLVSQGVDVKQALRQVSEQYLVSVKTLKKLYS